MTAADDVRMSPDAVAELYRLARSRPTSGRGMLAKASAIRTLERLQRKVTKAPPCPPDWHPGPVEFVELDEWWLEQHPDARERWWAALYWG